MKISIIVPLALAVAVLCVAFVQDQPVTEYKFVVARSSAETTIAQHAEKMANALAPDGWSLVASPGYVVDADTREMVLAFSRPKP